MITITSTCLLTSNKKKQAKRKNICRVLVLGCFCFVLPYILIYSAPRLDFLAKPFLEMDAAHAFAIANKILNDDTLKHDKPLAQEVDQTIKYACVAQLAAKFSTQEPRLVTMVSEEWVRKALKTAEILKYVNPEKYDEMFKTCMQTLLDSTPVDDDRQLVLISGYAGSMQAWADVLRVPEVDTKRRAIAAKDLACDYGSLSVCIAARFGKAVVCQHAQPTMSATTPIDEDQLAPISAYAGILRASAEVLRISQVESAVAAKTSEQLVSYYQSLAACMAALGV